MKKTFTFLAASLALVMSMTLTGCKKELKKVRGVASTVIIDDDTLRSLTVLTGEEDSIIFHLEDAQFTNGMMMPRDSVIVDYIDGKNDTARALVVTVLPAAAKYVDPTQNANKELITAPVESNDSTKKQ